MVLPWAYRSTLPPCTLAPAPPRRPAPPCLARGISGFLIQAIKSLGNRNKYNGQRLVNGLSVAVIEVGKFRFKSPGILTIRKKSGRTKNVIFVEAKNRTSNERGGYRGARRGRAAGRGGAGRDGGSAEAAQSGSPRARPLVFHTRTENNHAGRLFRSTNNGNPIETESKNTVTG